MEPIGEKISYTSRVPNIPVATKSPIDEEELSNAYEYPSVVNADVIKPVYNDTPINDTSNEVDELKKKIQANLEKMSQEAIENEDKAKVNIDADSVEVKNNVSDDEFFDDFFTDE